MENLNIISIETSLRNMPGTSNQYNTDLPSLSNNHTRTNNDRHSNLLHTSHLIKQEPDDDRPVQDNAALARITSAQGLPPVHTGPNMPKKKGPIPKLTGKERCLICDKLASGFNYLVLSCEGCKAFYRRSELKGSHTNYYCKDNNNCDLKAKVKRMCQKCRYDKCKALGMTLRDRYNTNNNNSLQLSQDRQAVSNEQRSILQSQRAEDEARNSQQIRSQQQLFQSQSSAQSQPSINQQISQDSGAFDTSLTINTSQASNLNHRPSLISNNSFITEHNNNNNHNNLILNNQNINLTNTSNANQLSHLTMNNLPLNLTIINNNNTNTTTSNVLNNSNHLNLSHTTQNSLCQSHHLGNNNNNNSNLSNFNLFQLTQNNSSNSTQNLTMNQNHNNNQLTLQNLTNNQNNSNNNNPVLNLSSSQESLNKLNSMNTESLFLKPNNLTAISGNNVLALSTERLNELTNDETLPSNLTTETTSSNALMIEKLRDKIRSDQSKAIKINNANTQLLLPDSFDQTTLNDFQFANSLSKSETNIKGSFDQLSSLNSLINKTGFDSQPQSFDQKNFLLNIDHTISNSHHSRHQSGIMENNSSSLLTNGNNLIKPISSLTTSLNLKRHPSDLELNNLNTMSSSFHLTSNKRNSLGNVSLNNLNNIENIDNNNINDLDTIKTLKNNVNLLNHQPTSINDSLNLNEEEIYKRISNPGLGQLQSNLNASALGLNVTNSNTTLSNNFKLNNISNPLEIITNNNDLNDLILRKQENISPAYTQPTSNNTQATLDVGDEHDDELSIRGDIPDYYASEKVKEDVPVFNNQDLGESRVYPNFLRRLEAKVRGRVSSKHKK